MRRSLGPGPPSKLILIDPNYGEVCDPSESLYCGKTAPNCSPNSEIYLDNLGLVEAWKGYQQLTKRWNRFSKQQDDRASQPRVNLPHCLFQKERWQKNEDIRPKF